MGDYYEWGSEGSGRGDGKGWLVSCEVGSAMGRSGSGRENA